jgi:hypothetical protein
MRLLRVRIADCMFLVGLIAVDSAAVRSLFALAAGSYNGTFWPAAWSMIIGALPMSNVLAVALLLAYRRPGSRSFLLGFLAAGAAALALFLVLTVCCYQSAIAPCLNVVYGVMRRVVDPGWPVVVLFPITFLIDFVSFILPQLVVALVGGFIFHKCRAIPAPYGPTP